MLFGGDERFAIDKSLPDYFLERYIEEFRWWAMNFAPEHHIVLKEGPFADPSPDEAMGPVLLRVTLVAEVTRSPPRCTFKPASERDAKLIRDHVQKLQGLGVASRQFWKEAPRTWVPAMPTIKPRSN